LEPPVFAGTLAEAAQTRQGKMKEIGLKKSQRQQGL
jgi:hypothetical protein